MPRVTNAQPGDRVRLDSCTDEYTKLEIGSEGTVKFVDDFGTVFIDWDCGSMLGLVEEAGDRFTVISRAD